MTVAYSAIYSFELLFFQLYYFIFHHANIAVITVIKNLLTLFALTPSPPRSSFYSTSTK